MSRFLPWVTPIAILVIISALLAGIVTGGRWLYRPVTTQARAEEQLERELIAFQRWNGESWIVADAENGRLIFDHLTVDAISIDWPPTPRWQWTGNWETQPITNAPASVSRASTEGELILWGQVNDPKIASLEVELEGAVRQYPVSTPGYIIRTGQTFRSTSPATARWLDASGRVIFTTKL